MADERARKKKDVARRARNKAAGTVVTDAPGRKALPLTIAAAPDLPLAPLRSAPPEKLPLASRDPERPVDLDAWWKEPLQRYLDEGPIPLTRTPPRDIELPPGTPGGHPHSLPPLGRADYMYRTDDPSPVWQHGGWREGPGASELRQRMRFLEGGAPPDLPPAPVTPAGDWQELKDTFGITGLQGAADRMATPVPMDKVPPGPSGPDPMLALRGAQTIKGRPSEDDLRRAHIASFMERYPEMAAVTDPWIRQSQRDVTDPMEALRFADTVGRRPSDRRDFVNARRAHDARTMGDMYHGPMPTRWEPGGFGGSEVDNPEYFGYVGPQQPEPEPGPGDEQALRDRVRAWLAARRGGY